MPFRMRQTQTIPFYHVSFILDALPFVENFNEKKYLKEYFSVLLLFSYDYVIRCIYFFLPIFIEYLRFKNLRRLRIDIIKMLNDR